MVKSTATAASLKKRLRSLARSLRPFVQEAENITRDCSDALEEIGEKARDPKDEYDCFDYNRLTPREQRKFDSYAGISELADDIFFNLEQVREDIAIDLRPMPRVQTSKEKNS